MKKIIWVFGESATGKKTLINYLMKQPNSELSINLGLENETINLVDITISQNLTSFDDNENEKRRHVQILESINKFNRDENGTVLLIKGQSNDMDERYGNTLKASSILFPDIMKEILLLEVHDLDILYERFIQKDWFLEDKIRYSQLFPREWLDGAVKKHREKVYSYQSLGFEITEIDSTYEFKIHNQKKQNIYSEKYSIK